MELKDPELRLGERDWARNPFNGIESRMLKDILGRGSVTGMNPFNGIESDRSLCFGINLVLLRIHSMELKVSNT